MKIQLKIQTFQYLDVIQYFGGKTWRNERITKINKERFFGCLEYHLCVSCLHKNSKVKNEWIKKG